MNNYKDAGVIYILTNKAFPNLVKIGYADDLYRRVNQLNASDALPYPFEIYAHYGVPCRLTDLKLHYLIDKLNPSLRTRSEINGRARVREFFELTPEDAYSILDAIAEITDTKDHLVRDSSNTCCATSTEAIKYNRGNNLRIVKFENNSAINNAVTNSLNLNVLNDKTFRFISSTILAYMRIVDGKYIVLKNSQLQYPDSPILQHSVAEIRRKLERENKITIDGKVGVLLENVYFNSASAAAKFVCGSSRDGWVSWKDEDGNILDSYRKK